MKVYALLTGRGNNTLENKNILPVLGKPLLYYTATAAKNCNLISEYYVSSDNDEILNTAGELGYLKIKRPPKISTPTAKHIDAIEHALKVIELREGHEPDILIVQLANTVTVKTEWIEACINEIIEDPSISAVVPAILDQENHPYRMKRLNEKGYLSSYFKHENQRISSNRQELPNNYKISHNFWVLNVSKSINSKNGDQPWEFMGNNIKPYIVKEAFDVHDLDDLKKSERWLKENKVF